MLEWNGVQLIWSSNELGVGEQRAGHELARGQDEIEISRCDRRNGVRVAEPRQNVLSCAQENLRDRRIGTRLPRAAPIGGTGGAILVRSVSLLTMNLHRPAGHAERDSRSRTARRTFR